MTENFYTATLFGGLGNQMFQVAHAVCQGYKYNIRTMFRKEASVPNQGRQTCYYFDNIFRKISFTDEIENTNIVEEKSWNDPQIYFNPAENIEFRGYFQSSKNFQGYNSDIRNLFEPSEEFLNKIYKRYPTLNNDNTISIHVRRGDYFRFSNVMPIVDISYIENCLSQIGSDKQIFFFTDDKNWVKNNFYLQNACLVEDLEDFEELWMISLCKTNILSCSSFSWWGTFLNKNFNKKVYAPSVWFGPEGPYPFYNVYENDWNIINVELKNGFLCC